MKSPLLRSIAVSLSVILFATNCALAHSPEINFWKERQKKGQDLNESLNGSTQLASLPLNLQVSPTQILNKLPAPFSENFKSSLSSQVERQIPKNLESKFSPIFKALSSNYGNVRKVSVPENRKVNKTIIHIQDIHMNQEAQGNIGKAVQDLIDKKVIQLVGLEGAFNPIDLSSVRSFENKQAIQIVADYLLSENRISGAVHAAFVSPNSIPPIVGVDDATHYKANISAYQVSVKEKERTRKYVEALNQKIRLQEGSLMSPALATFHSQVKLYRDGKLPLGDYVKFLVQQNPATSTDVEVFLEAYNMENSLNFSQVESERSVLLSQLLTKLTKKETSQLLNTSVAYRMGNINHADFYQVLKDLCGQKQISLSRFGAIDSYIQYVLLTEAINPDKLLLDVASMEKEDYQALIKKESDRKLIAESKQLYLVGKLLDFALTPEEWKEYKASNVSSSNIGDLSSFEKFYEEAEARNEAITKNLLKAMNNSQSQVAVLVTGGFHSPGIDQLMKAAGVTTITYVPKVTKVESENSSAYLSVFAQEKTPLDQLFKGEKLFVAQAPNQISLAPSLLTATENHLTSQRSVVDITKNAGRLTVKFANDHRILSVAFVASMGLAAILNTMSQQMAVYVLTAVPLGYALILPNLYLFVSNKRLRKVGFITITLFLSALSSSFGQTAQGLKFLTNNVTTETQMPLSYKAPTNYWNIIGSQTNNINDILERLLTTYSLNLYDGALWQISMARNNNFVLADSHTDRLNEGSSGGLNQIRAANDPFRYGDRREKLGGQAAFFFRIISDQYNQVDPLDGKDYLQGFPTFPNLHHEDWMPIMGENAWIILGEMQTAFLKYHGKIPSDAKELRLAISLLPAFEAMQSPIGGVYHAPFGTNAKDSSEISNENNVSLETTLSFLKTVIEGLQSYDQDGYEKLSPNLSIIDKLLKGQENYFKNYSYDRTSGLIFQGGRYKNEKFTSNKVFAVDCQTWPLARFGVKKIDSWFGEGTGYRMWQETKKRGGYYVDGVLRGVGFTDHPRHDVLSGEWTAGAILACLVAAEEYKATHPEWAKELRDDALRMREGVSELKVTLDDGSVAYLYANKRFQIPFGWWANPISSLASTVWIMSFLDGIPAQKVDTIYNPFILGGKTTIPVLDINNSSYKVKSPTVNSQIKPFGPKEHSYYEFAGSNFYRIMEFNEDESKEILTHETIELELAIADLKDLQEVVASFIVPVAPFENKIQRIVFKRGESSWESDDDSEKLTIRISAKDITIPRITKIIVNTGSGKSTAPGYFSGKNITSQKLIIRATGTRNKESGQEPIRKPSAQLEIPNPNANAQIGSNLKSISTLPIFRWYQNKFVATMALSFTVIISAAAQGQVDGVNNLGTSFSFLDIALILGFIGFFASVMTKKSNSENDKNTLKSLALVASILAFGFILIHHLVPILKTYKTRANNKPTAVAEQQFFSTNRTEAAIEAWWLQYGTMMGLVQLLASGEHPIIEAPLFTAQKKLTPEVSAASTEFSHLRLLFTYDTQVNFDDARAYSIVVKDQNGKLLSNLLVARLPGGQWTNFATMTGGVKPIRAIMNPEKEGIKSGPYEITIPIPSLSAKQQIGEVEVTADQFKTKDGKIADGKDSPQPMEIDAFPVNPKAPSQQKINPKANQPIKPRAAKATPILGKLIKGTGVFIVGLFLMGLVPGQTAFAQTAQGFRFLTNNVNSPMSQEINTSPETGFIEFLNKEQQALKEKYFKVQVDNQKKIGSVDYSESAQNGSYSLHVESSPGFILVETLDHAGWQTIKQRLLLTATNSVVTFSSVDFPEKSVTIEGATPFKSLFLISSFGSPRKISLNLSAEFVQKVTQQLPNFFDGRIQNWPSSSVPQKQARSTEKVTPFLKSVSKVVAISAIIIVGFFSSMVSSVVAQTPSLNSVNPLSSVRQELTISHEQSVLNVLSNLSNQIKKSDWLGSSNRTELGNIIGRVMAEKDVKFENGIGARQDRPARIADLPSNTLMVNSNTFEQLRPEDMPHIFFHEANHLMPIQRARAALSISLMKELPKSFRSVLSSKIHRENFKKVFALDVRNEIEALKLEIDFLKDEARRFGFKDLNSYLSHMESLAKFPYLAKAYRNLSRLATDPVAEDDAIFALVFTSGDKDQTDLLGEIGKLEGVNIFNPIEAKKWVLSWAKDPSYYNPPSKNNKQGTAGINGNVDLERLSKSIVRVIKNEATAEDWAQIPLGVGAVTDYSGNSGIKALSDHDLQSKLMSMVHNELKGTHLRLDEKGILDKTFQVGLALQPVNADVKKLSYLLIVPDFETDPKGFSEKIDEANRLFKELGFTNIQLEVRNTDTSELKKYWSGQFIARANRLDPNVLSDGDSFIRHGIQSIANRGSLILVIPDQLFGNMGQHRLGGEDIQVVRLSALLMGAPQIVPLSLMMAIYKVVQQHA